jgi:hypothetical protein
VLVYSVHGWRHFLVCNTHIAFRLLRRGKKYEIACTSWSSCLWKLCELVSNIEEQLCIVFMYTGNLYHLHDLATQTLVSFKKYMPPPLQVSRNLKVILTPIFTATHAFCLSHHYFPMICDWGIFFILVTLDLSLLLIHRDLWNSQKWQILISVKRDLDLIYFLIFVTPPPPSFKVSVYGKGDSSKYM